MKQTLFILLMGCSLIQLHAQEEYRYFPTGMKWKEVIADPFSSLPLDTVYSVQYEIGEDTLVNDRLCKTILMDGKPLERWIIEENEKVWIFTNDYPDPIQIYDFNWNGDKSYYEFLRVYETSHETGGSSYQPELVRSYLNQDEIEVTSYNNHTIEYLMDFEGVVIRHKGRVSDMNRNSCLLGYKIVDPILPGLEFIKVLWIVRDGKEIFRSENAEEWVVDIPSVIDDIPILGDVNGDGAHDKCKLYQNTPNPFGTNTVIRYSIPNDVANAQIIISDLQGKRLSQIPISPSDDNVTLNGTEFPAGMYISSLIADNKVVATKRMIVVK